MRVVAARLVVLTALALTVLGGASCSSASTTRMKVTSVDAKHVCGSFKPDGGTVPGTDDWIVCFGLPIPGIDTQQITVGACIVIQEGPTVPDPADQFEKPKGGDLVDCDGFKFGR